MKKAKVLQDQNPAGAMKDHVGIADRTITIKKAKELWQQKFEVPITDQTMRNWVKRFGLGTKFSFLSRSPWVVDSEKFNWFLANFLELIKQK